ncbi:MAG: hypothetical protein JWN25_1158 [Verrucomicrobiales bacterium]|nr:hypothetical protein [Verrucomicrobiales bacterium]
MIPREILKRIRQIEIRTRRLVTESLAGQYHSVFKGHGMNFEEVREYQPGDDIRALDWNVTARTNVPHVKKFVEERELTVILVVDLSGSGLFGSGRQSKRELAAEIASVLAFSAIRNNDKVGLILFTEEVEKFIAPGKGRRHVLRVIREVLCFEPKLSGTNLNRALEFVRHISSHRSIVIVLSDFLDHHDSKNRRAMALSQSMISLSFSAIKQLNRRHDLIVIQLIDRYEMELPNLGLLVLKDAETGEVVEVDTTDLAKRRRFEQRQRETHANLAKMLGSVDIEILQLQTHLPYDRQLIHFFGNRSKKLHRT